jgi:hypothetical protein
MKAHVIVTRQRIVVARARTVFDDRRMEIREPQMETELH